MLSVKLFFFSALAALIVGCGAKNPNSRVSQSEDAVAGGFLSQEQFKVTDDIQEMDENVTAKFISSLDFFYFRKTPVAKDDADLHLAESAGTSPLCEIKQDTLIYDANDKSLHMSYVYDDSQCPESKEKFLNKMRVFIAITCSETDLAQYAGQSVRKFLYTAGAQDFCPEDKTQKTFINAEYEKTASNEVAKVIGGLMRADGKACVATFENGTYKRDDCSFLHRTEVTDVAAKATKTSRLAILKAEGLSSEGGGRYYGHGKVAMQVNQWEGYMIYTADNIAPTYTLESSSKKIKGSFQAGIFESTAK